MTVSSVKNSLPSTFKAEPVKTQEDNRYDFLPKIIENQFPWHCPSPCIRYPTKTEESPLIKEFLRAEIPSSKLMEMIVSSQSLMNRLLDLAETRPEILMKKNKNNETILDVFVKFASVDCYDEHPPFNPYLGQLKLSGTFKRLLLAAPWNGDDLVRNLNAIKEKAPYLFEMSKWDHVLSELQNRSNLTLEQKISITLLLIVYCRFNPLY